MSLRWKIAQAAEIRWWRRYLKTKDKKEYIAWKQSYWQTFFEKTSLVLAKDARILDAGCGPAGIFMLFKEQPVDALDPLLDSYQADLPHFEKSDYPNTRFIALPLEVFQKHELYDAVFCLNAINHVADLDKSFDVLVAATKRGGDLTISIDAHNYIGLKRIFQFLPGDILHPHQYDLKDYQNMLIQRDCSIERTILYKKEFIFSYYVLVAKKN